VQIILSNSQIDFFQFKTTINNLNDQLIGMSVASNFTGMQILANQAFYVVELFLWVYAILEKNILQTLHFQETNIEKITWKHPVDNCYS